MCWAGTLLASCIPDSIDDVLIKQKAVFNKMMPSSQFIMGKLYSRLSEGIDWYLCCLLAVPPFSLPGSEGVVEISHCTA